MPRKTGDVRRARAAQRRFNEAAARCRGKLVKVYKTGDAKLIASMRPRPDAAENSITVQRWALRRYRFNEAAARCRGKHVNVSPRKRPKRVLQ